MTNVPDNLREMWADIYKLFDLNYKMENTSQAWNKYWDQVEQLLKKHNRYPYVMDLARIVSEMIEYRMKAETNGNYPCTLEEMNLF